ncbi:hypothetical protein IAU59_000868 [Kwoniella sp. CBS 9459]
MSESEGHKRTAIDEVQKEEDHSQHPVHQDPRDDIVLISKDGMELRASAFHLERVSPLFEDMLSLPQPERDDEEPAYQKEPVHLDFSSSVVCLFLDLATSHRPSLPPLEMIEAKDLLALTEFTISEELAKVANQAVLTAFADQPFELLVLASDRNDVPMARQALARIDAPSVKRYLFSTSARIPSPEDKKRFQDILQRLSPAFRLELLSILMECGKVSEKEDSYAPFRPGFFLRDDWSDVADKFNPPM